LRGRVRNAVLPLKWQNHITPDAAVFVPDGFIRTLPGIKVTPGNDIEVKHFHKVVIDEDLSEAETTVRRSALFGVKITAAPPAPVRPKP
jgi:hypothetical protein